MNKKEWLDKLYYDVGKQQYDFELCGLRKVGDEVIATKWKKYSEVIFPLDPWEDKKIEWVNNRTILPNELVLDIEDPKRIDEIMVGLKKFKFNIKLYKTGSRGYHIHIFFNEEISRENELFFIKRFRTDELKIGSKVMIALENCPHWKTGKIKEEIEWEK